MEIKEKQCTLCGKLKDSAEKKSIFAHAGEWLAEGIWNDGGELCNRCLENRGRLAMMYMHDKNR